MAFQRKYQESYLNFGFITTDDSYSSSLFCICGNWISNEAMRPLKLLCYVDPKHPALRTSLWSFSKEKNVNTKNRSNYWRPPLHQMCLSDWEHHSWWLTALLKLRSPLLLVNSWSCLLLRTFVTNFQERLQFKRWYMAPAKMEAYVDMLCFLTQLKEGQQPI